MSGCQFVLQCRTATHSSWRHPYLRGNALSMTVWESYTAVLDACCDAWNGLMKDAGRIVSITTRTWAQIKT